MKNLATTVVLAVLFYLAGAFVAVNLDISAWSADGRVILCLSWACLSGFFAAMRYLDGP